MHPVALDGGTLTPLSRRPSLINTMARIGNRATSGRGGALLNHRRQLAVAILAIAICPIVGMAADSVESQAQAADLAWLAMVDQGKYAQSWEAASDFFQSAMKEADWERALDHARTPLGRVVKRKVSTSNYTTSLPGAPDGQYVVTSFSTQFEHKSSAQEKVVAKRGQDGNWRVTGYFIH